MTLHQLIYSIFHSVTTNVINSDNYLIA